MDNCQEQLIDQQSPLGAELTKLRGALDPQALEFIPTAGLLFGSYLKMLHVATNATLTYVLRPTANPGPEDGWGVTPDDFLAGVNEVYWSLEALHKDGNPGIWNADLDGGPPNGVAGTFRRQSTLSTRSLIWTTHPAES